MNNKTKQPDEVELFRVMLVKTGADNEPSLKIYGKDMIMKDPIGYIRLIRDISNIMVDHYLKIIIDMQSKITNPQIIPKPDLKNLKIDIKKS